MMTEPLVVADAVASASTCAEAVSDARRCLCTTFTMCTWATDRVDPGFDSVIHIFFRSHDNAYTRARMRVGRVARCVHDV